MHFILSFRLSLFRVASLLALCFLNAVNAVEPQTTDYPAVKLRGYGTLSGNATTSVIDGQPASTLKIVCDDEAKAKLVQAKYISDLQTFSGVKPIAIPASQGSLPGYQAEDQGVFLAARGGSTVTILSAATPKAIVTLLATAFASGTGSLSFSSDTQVPMYLDRWDKYGFRFYYSPFAVPKGPDNRLVKDYDPTQDFLFAQKNNHAGLTLWHSPLAVDNAAGITQITWWDWVLKAGQKKQLPVGINDGNDRATWAYNRYQDQITGFQPGFLGGWYGSMNFMEDILSWNAFAARDEVLAEVQASLKQVKDYDNITSWLEPHEEMGHGVADLLLEYGPVADQGYHKFLQETYGDVATVSKRWYGDETTLKSWDDIHAPEVASFLGWSSDAIDLAGLWRIGYDAPFSEDSGAKSLDDSKWPEITAPNHAIVRFLPRKPAVFRRHITIDPAWRSAHDQVWLYVWDLNDTRNNKSDPNSRVLIYVNGAYLPETPEKVTQDHWVALDVSKILTSGDNLVAITLPRGMFNYRVYLSPHAPVLYPDLGAQKNAQWIDYYDWNAWLRASAVRRGAQMIRQIDPDRGIMFMAPDSYLNGISQVAKDYGGDFHNTGSMAGFWCDPLPSVARGMGLPMSAEPGGPAHDLTEFKRFWGLWLTEDVNAVDYFGDESDILWNPEKKKYFEDHLNLISSFGKYHPPTAEAAVLYSARNNDLLDFPWSGGQGYGGSNPLHLGSGYSKWNSRAVLRGFYESDGLVESSFARGDAAKYKVIIDSNTSIMNDKLLAGIEKYVRDGGTFVTYVQTGRHSEIQRDAWPIEKLTGYHVTRLDQSTPWEKNQLKWAPNQPIFSGDWMNLSPSDGLSLKKVADDVQDLAYWKDGSVAIGMRPLGKGAIIEIGCRFTQWGLPDRIDQDIRGYLQKAYGRTKEYGLTDNPDAKLMGPELYATSQVFGQILKWRGVKSIPAQVEPENDDTLLRHYVTNNGLYDVWTVWNQNTTKTISANVVLAGLNPAWAMNLNDGTRLDLKDHQIPIHLEPIETVIYLTPHGDPATAPQQWFGLQRNWWQGTADPGAPLAPFKTDLVVNLTADWAFQPLPEAQTDVTALIDPKLDDSTWKRMELGIFTIPDYPDARHALFRKTFTVPANWNHGKVALWLCSWNDTTFLGTGQVYLDGKMILKASANGIMGNEVDGALQAGTTHQLAVEISDKNTLLGSRGPAWLAYHPTSAAQQDLAGDWELSSDGMTYRPATPLPGKVDMANRRIIKIDAAQSARTVVFHAVADREAIRGIIVNGRFVMRHHHNIGPEVDLNITPWVKFGQDNELIIMDGGNGSLKELSLEFHEKGTYP
jgi:hypothetical protein